MYIRNGRWAWVCKLSVGTELGYTFWLAIATVLTMFRCTLRSCRCESLHFQRKKKEKNANGREDGREKDNRKWKKARAGGGGGKREEGRRCSSSCPQSAYVRTWQNTASLCADPHYVSPLNFCFHIHHPRVLQHQIGPQLPSLRCLCKNYGYLKRIKTSL